MAAEWSIMFLRHGASVIAYTALPKDPDDQAGFAFDALCTIRVPDEQLAILKQAADNVAAMTDRRERAQAWRKVEDLAGQIAHRYGRIVK